MKKITEKQLKKLDRKLNKLDDMCSNGVIYSNDLILSILIDIRNMLETCIEDIEIEYEED